MAAVDAWGPYWFSADGGPAAQGAYGYYVFGPDSRIDDAAFAVTANPLVQYVGEQMSMATTSVSLGNRLYNLGIIERKLYATVQNVGVDRIRWFKIFIARVGL